MRRAEPLSGSHNFVGVRDPDLRVPRQPQGLGLRV